MSLTTEFKPIALEDLRREAAVLRADGWRFIQTHAVKGEQGVDLYYSFMQDGHALNLKIEGVTSDQPVPSITDMFLAAFVFENEARELFGVDMRDIAIDFQGAMYAPAESEPMTFITPEQKAAKEKALKAATAKESPKKQGSGAEAAATSGKRRAFKMTPELQARLDAKYATLSDEKKAKVDAALAALAAPESEAETTSDGGDTAPVIGGKTTEEPKDSAAPAEQAPPVDEDLEKLIAAMDPQKAAKVRAAISGKEVEGAGDSREKASSGSAETPAELIADEQVNALIGLMDDAKAATVRAALAAKGGE